VVLALAAGGGLVSEADDLLQAAYDTRIRTAVTLYNGEVWYVVERYEEVAEAVSDGITERRLVRLRALLGADQEPIMASFSAAMVAVITEVTEERWQEMEKRATARGRAYADRLRVAGLPDSPG
jgi:hypothetical protein